MAKKKAKSKRTTAPKPKRRTSKPPAVAVDALWARFNVTTDPAKRKALYAEIAGLGAKPGQPAT